MKSIRRSCVIAILSLISSSFLVTRGGAAVIDPCPRETRAVRPVTEQLALRTLKLEVSPMKDEYRIGEVAKFEALVTRPADEDPAGQGIPMERPFVTPAPDVTIGVGLLFPGDVYLPGFGVSDEDGKAILKVKIMDYVKPGPVHASFFASKTVVEANCARVDEIAYVPMSNAFPVKKPRR